MDENPTQDQAKENAQAEGEPKKEQAKEKAGGKQLKEIFDGTARIRQSIGQAFKGVADVFRGRDYVVMVRVNKQSLDRIDELVDSGLFKSRSESAAFLIARGIDANTEVYERIEDKVSQINKLKGELQEMIGSGDE